jgi:hypothetical protein
MQYSTHFNMSQTENENENSNILNKNESQLYHDISAALA